MKNWKIFGVLLFSVSGLLIPQSSFAQTDAEPIKILVTNDAGFIPSVVRIFVGDTIIWHNDDNVSHNIISGFPETRQTAFFDSGIINSQGSFEFTFEEDGVFPYFDQIHPELTGLVIVEVVPLMTADDSDNDGVPSSQDNCPAVYNPSQVDSDRLCSNTCAGFRTCGAFGNSCCNWQEVCTVGGDGIGDQCDVCPMDYDPDQGDFDNDGLGNDCDICPQHPNPDQLDSDRDGIGDACDVCPNNIFNIDNDDDGYCFDIDCDDNDSSVNPGGTEICSDNLDNDCRNGDLTCLEQFSPAIMLTSGYETSDDFSPKTISSMLQESDLRGPYHAVYEEVCVVVCVDVFTGWSSKYDGVPVSVNSLLNHNSGDYDLDMIGADPGFVSGFYDVPSPNRFDSHETNVYGRETQSSDGSSWKRVLQYWMFYPYNNWINNHEGDWELVQVILDDATRNPERITFSWHFGGTTFDWEDSDVEKIGITHPIVYVASGSHASWWSSGSHTFWQDPPILPGGCQDYTDSTSPVAQRLVAQGSGIPSFTDLYSLSEISSATPWISWRGHWGEVENDATDGDRGPTGPRFAKIERSDGDIFKWNTPLTYANDPMSSNYAACLRSPALLHIYDSQENHVGFNSTGFIEKNIPSLYLYDEKGKGAIFTTDEDLKFVIEATDEGKFGFDLIIYDGSTSTNFVVQYNDVEIESTTLATLQVDSTNPEFIMQIDVEGDGIIDYTKAPDVLDVTQNDVKKFKEILKDDSIAKPTFVIPLWIKDNAKWWSQGLIMDSDFAQGLQYLISENIIQIPITHTSSQTTSELIPNWVKTNAGWWADGIIDDQEFVNAIQYLVQEGIILV